MKTLGNILIFGDSYSTLEGYIPQGYAVYYSLNREDTAHFNIGAPEDTWWGKVIQATNSTLLLNDSWSGSTVCHTGYSGYNENQSFVGRLNKYIAEGFFEKNEIDTVFVFGGTNDSWSDAPLGEEMSEGWKREDFFHVLPAVHYFFKKLREILPDAKIYGIGNCGIKGVIVDAIVHACERIGAKAIVLTDAVDKKSGHPTVQGMIDIKDQVLAALD